MAAALAAALAASAVLRSAPAAADDGSAPRTLARGRALVWGATALVPMIIGDAREIDGRLIRYLAPGGGVEARVGYELPGGLALALAGGVTAHASENSRSLGLYRVLGEVRWAVDAGGEVAPLLGLGAGLLLAHLDRGTAPTAMARVLAGIEWLPAPWMAIEFSLAMEGALGGEAFADSIVAATPRIGVAFSE
jgi:hypothetical protein